MQYFTLKLHGSIKFYMVEEGRVYLPELSKKGIANG